jgi:polyphenol oxidase
VKQHRQILITPRWDAPENVVALVTTRTGGVSQAPWQGFNLARHVADDVHAVQQNRIRLKALLPEPVPVQWLEQIHSTDVMVPVFPSVEQDDPAEQRADAIFISNPGIGGAVLTADCLPVFFADRSGGSVAVAHAGWRGLANGVLENTLAQFKLPPEDIVAWLGPAIGPCHFETGEEVRDVFLSQLRNDRERDELSQIAFLPAAAQGKWMTDLYALARWRLHKAGLTRIAGGDYCTYCDQDHFYSYRRDGVTGRMASLIYLKAF